MELTNREKVAWSGVAVSALLVLATAIIYIIYAPAFCDAAYYILVSQKVASGAGLYTDIFFSYPPLVVETLAFLEKVFGIGYDSRFYIVFDLTVVAACIALVYNVARALDLSRLLSAIATAMFAVTVMVLETDYAILLEPFSVMFGLASILLTLKSGSRWWMTLLAGVVASGAFWCKQYGAGFFFLCGIIILFDARTIKEAFKQGALFVAGYSISFILCFLLWRECFMAVVLVSYGTDTSATDWYATHNRPVVWAIEFLFYRYAPFIVGLLLLPFAKEKLNRRTVRDLLLLVCGTAGFMCQYYFAQSQHYFIYVVPFTSILMPYLWKLVNGKKGARIFYDTLCTVAVVMTLFTLLYERLGVAYGKYFIGNNARATERYVAKEITGGIGEGAKVFNANTYTYFINQFAELTPSEWHGMLYYDFGPLDFNEECIRERMENADYAIYIPESFEGDYETLINKYMPNRTEILSFPYGEMTIKVVKNSEKMPF